MCVNLPTASRGPTRSTWRWLKRCKGTSMWQIGGRCTCLATSWCDGRQVECMGSNAIQQKERAVNSPEVEQRRMCPSFSKHITTWNLGSVDKAVVAGQTACAVESSALSRNGRRSSGAKQESTGGHERASMATMSSPGRWHISQVNSEI